ncbi:MAG: ABC transporter permease [Acidobacteriota bacterium]
MTEMMLWRRTLEPAAQAISREPGRTALSTAAIAVGVAAVALLEALGAGAERAFQEMLEQQGRNLLAVNAARLESDALRGSSRRVQTLRLADERALRRIAGVERTVPFASGSRQVRSGGDVLPTTVVDSTAELQRAKNYTLLAGRFIDDHDVAVRSRVVVVGAFITRELFAGEWPLGEPLYIGGVPFTVVGLLQAKGTSPDGFFEDDQVIIPISTAQRRLLDVDSLDRIFVQASSRGELQRVARDLRGVLRQRDGLDRGRLADDFVIRDQTRLLAAQRQAGGAFSRLIAGLAALALGLGGLGLLAVSLLSVRARLGEIGLRLAVGARRRDILGQFLGESVLTAALGGLAGLILGLFAIQLGAELSRWNLVLTWRSVIVPLAVSLVIAVLFGAYPALRAARLDPIAALQSP